MIECICEEKFGHELLFEMHVENEHNSEDYDKHVKNISIPRLNLNG